MSIRGAKPLNAYDSINWAGATRDVTQFYAFTIAPAGFSSYALTSLEYTDRRSLEGPRNFEVDYSFDGGSTLNLIGSYIRADSDILNHREIFNLSGISGLQNLTQPVTFFIFGWNAVSNNGAYRLGNETSTGNPIFPNNLILTTADAVQTIPEPSTVFLAGVGVLTLVGYGWRRRRA